MLIQVVFLIDTDIDRCFNESPVLLSNAVCRSCFRLLHHFSSDHEKRGTIGKSRFSSSSVKWGYKFFRRNLGQSRIETHKLYDFKLKYFEEFENDVHRRFELSASSRHTANESKSKQVKSVESLSRSLTELLADFQWENPDLMSPIKGKRNKKSDNIRTNHVFLFTKCPKNASELKDFTGKQVPDADIFLHSVFPNTLYQQFCHVARLSMHWIDTEHVSSMCNTDAQSVQLVEKAVNKTGGKLTDLNALVKHGSHHYSDINKLYVDDITELEVASFTGTDSAFTSTLIPQSSFLSSLLSRQNNVIKKVTKQAQDEVTMKIGNLEYEVHLEPVEKERQLNKKTENKSTNTRKIGKSCTKLKHLQSYGVLCNSHVISLHLDIQKCYICVQPVNCVQKQKQGEDRNDNFTKLLSNMASNDLDIVLICEDSGQFVLLRPLTVSTATLSVIGTDNSLLLEKQRLLSTSGDKLSEETSKLTGSKDDLIDRLVSSVHVTKPNDTKETTEVCNFDACYMDRWIVPGQSETLQKLVTKLYSRISDLDFLSPDETSLLKQLQTCYKQKNKPPGLRDTSTPTTAVLPEITDQFELHGKNKASRLSLSRTDMILCKSKAVVRERGQIKDDTKIKPDKNKREVVANIADFTSEEELKQYLISSYERVIKGEITSIDITVSSMVTVVLHYMKQIIQSDNIEERCIKLLEETVLTTGTLLREKFTNSTDITDEQKIAEYKTQVMLRLEIISTIQNKDQSEEEDGNEEIVGFLRALSFLSEPGLLSKFMESCIVTNYIHSIPQTLGNLYDELMQPLPEELSNILSPDSISPQRSVFNESLTSGPPSTRTRSHGSVGPSSQPGSQAAFNLDSSLNKSRGGRKLMHHYSVDLGTKRQIVVDKISNKKSEKRSTKKCKDSHRQSKEKVAKSLFDKPKDSVKLERRQSVHVMQHSNKTPKKQSLKSPRRFASPRRKLVAETPSHKQVSHVMKRESLLRRHSMADEIMTGVVAESPEKTCDTSIKESPTKGKRTKALLRRSFYSAGPVKRTKNLTQYFQLADRIAGRKRQASGSADSNKPVKLLKLEPSSQFKSPDKNSSFLLSQLVASPSPAKTTPRKRNMTPRKLLDSPSQSTRSKLGMSPSTLVFGSPCRGQKVLSPSQHMVNSPVTRQQSSRILVADSDVKDGPKSPVVTPEKVHGTGVLSFGLDSPNQSIPKKISQTPTRKSVRAVLFAKSPASTRKESPFRNRGTSSPRTLLQKFSSPTKKGQETHFVTGADDTKSKSSHLAALVYDDHKDSSTAALKSKTNITDCANNVERTPPHTKKVTKTPDSFDKWHRRKPRMSQSSPSVHKVTMVTSGCEVGKSYVNKDSDNVNSIDGNSSSRISSRSSKKRSLILSPDKNTNHSYKRMRTLDSEMSFMTGSQGFDVSSSFDEMSQLSGARSVDYFSSANDDVFLSQDSSNMDVENSENLGRLTGSENSGCFQNNSMIKSKTFERLLSDSVPFMQWTDAERSESPIFGSSVCNRTRNKSGSSNKFASAVSNTSAVETKTDLNQVSPKPVRQSPVANKKFSPNVSAKSLMHLIQSPLLKSPDGNSSQSDKLRQSGRGERSRRSLKLQN
ncbi:hypothetical protein ACF0H5_013692 [Mactra antiquata]